MSAWLQATLCRILRRSKWHYPIGIAVGIAVLQENIPIAQANSRVASFGWSVSAHAFPSNPAAVSQHDGGLASRVPRSSSPKTVRFGNWIANFRAFRSGKAVETRIADSWQDGHKFTAVYCLCTFTACTSHFVNVMQARILFANPSIERKFSSI